MFYKLPPRVQIFSIAITLSILIMIYGKYRCENKFKDPLMDGKEICRICDWWSISHFAFNFALAFSYPQYGFFIFTLGLLWELFEYSVQKGHLRKIPILNKIDQLSRCKSDRENKSHWVYYELTDIPMNIAGILVGIYVRKTFFK